MRPFHKTANNSKYEIRRVGCGSAYIVFRIRGPQLGSRAL